MTAQWTLSVCLVDKWVIATDCETKTEKTVYRQVANFFLVLFSPQKYRSLREFYDFREFSSKILFLEMSENLYA